MKPMNNTIVIIEDNLDNQVLFEAMLEGHFNIELHAAGQPALEAFESKRPDLVLLDISLPGMDGLEVLRRIRERESMSGVPVIALTAHAMAGDRERFLAAGFCDYISKPVVDEEAFVAVVRSHLSASPSEGA